MPEGRGEEHRGLKAEMGSHLSHSEMLIFFLFPSPFPFLRKMSPMREVRIHTAWPRKATGLSRTNADLMTFFHLPPWEPLTWTWARAWLPCQATQFGNGWEQDNHHTTVPWTKLRTSVLHLRWLSWRRRHWKHFRRTTAGERLARAGPARFTLSEEHCDHQQTFIDRHI